MTDLWKTKAYKSLTARERRLFEKQKTYEGKLGVLLVKIVLGSEWLISASSELPSLSPKQTCDELVH